MRRGVYAGWDGDRPTKNLDATIHEIDPGVTSTIHRHSWDAIMFIEEGSGWTEIDGQRIEWKPWDTLHLPAWAWHRHGNDGDKPARFHTWSVQPMLEQFGVALLEEGGDTPVGELPPRPTPGHPARRRRPVRPPHAAPVAPVGGERERPPDHALRRRQGHGHQARRAQPVHGRQVHRLPHGRAVGGHARAGPRALPVAPPARRRGLAVRDLRDGLLDHRRGAPRVGGRRPDRGRPLGLAPALQRLIRADRAPGARPQLRRAVRHDADPRWTR